ncbi:MAG: saccharopine dehydrogenase NADP-binding domain-containing protein, partial [Pirellulales bacterium]
MNDSLLIYGAYGYTGRLIARLAAERGLSPTLAGRNAEKLKTITAETGLDGLAFSLDSAASIAEHLAGFSAVLHCAGPFSATAAPMMAACLQAGVHYLDITGEISVIEHAHGLDAAAKTAGVALMPAVGFDVVPSDCLAAKLAAELPSATHLELAFAGMESISPGTAKTMFENMPDGGRVRRAGQIIRVPAAHEVREIDFGARKFWTMAIPWGDVASAYYSTGIGNITVFTAVPKKQIDAIRRFRWLAPLLKLPGVIPLGKKLIERRVPGPSDADRAKSRVHFWGRVYDDEGNEKQAVMTTPSGYQLTAETALECALRAARG